MSPFEAVPVRRPREQVEAQLRAAIMGGAFEDGARLPSEHDLSVQFGVSRATIREALRSLANDGLVRKTPGAKGGSFVQLLDMSSLELRLRDSLGGLLQIGSITLEEMTELRRVLEPATGALAARRRSQGHLDVLRALMKEADEATVMDDAVDRLLVRFHLSLSDASGNRLASAFIAAVHGVDLGVTRFHYPDGYLLAVQHHHGRILQAVEDGDAEAVRAALEAEFEYLEGVHLKTAERLH